MDGYFVKVSGSKGRGPILAPRVPFPLKTISPRTSPDRALLIVLRRHVHLIVWTIFLNSYRFPTQSDVSQNGIAGPHDNSLSKRRLSWASFRYTTPTSSRSDRSACSHGNAQY